jgi:hypothetical protein
MNSCFSDRVYNEPTRRLKAPLPVASQLVHAALDVQGYSKAGEAEILL